jgi:hypothetical protein
LGAELPAAIDDALVEGGFKGASGAPALNTVLHRLSVLSKAHRMRDVTNSVRDPSGHRSVPTFLQYFHAGAVQLSGCAWQNESRRVVQRDS